jgi:hypothetical protein
MKRAAANIVATTIDIGMTVFESAPPVDEPEPELELCPPEPLGTDESPLVLFGYGKLVFRLLSR